MATGGREQGVDKRRTCSVCLEPLKGRQPKLLNCFHTFCSPCLVQLAERETARSRQVWRGEEDDGGADRKDLPVLLTCPTCRAGIPVPPGGVSHLQTNFYLDEDGDEDDLRPVLCDLCEEGQQAQYHCASCSCCICSRCRRFHNRLCKSSVVSVVTGRADSTGTTALLKEGREIARKTEEVVKKVGVTKSQQQASSSREPARTTQTEPPTDHAVDPPENMSSKMGELTARLEDLSARCTQSEKVTAGLQAQNSALCRDLGALQDKNTTMSADFTALQKEMASQRREFLSIREKYMLLSQENHSLRSDVNSLQADRNKLKSDHDKLQADHGKLQADHGKLQADHDKLQADHDKLQADQKVGADVGQLQTDQEQLKKDQNSVRSEVRILRRDMGQIQGLVEKKRSAIAALETQLTTLNVAVAFHAILTDTVTVRQPQTIICTGVITNVGGGYNIQTGIFTAPVSGTYCFMASSSPGSDDVGDTAALFILKEGQEIAYLSAFGKGKATCHCVVPVKAGERVRLKSFHNAYGDKRRFSGRWVTSFTGVLLRPQL